MMRRFYVVGLIFLLASCSTAERNLQPLEAPTAAVTATAEPWPIFQNSDFSISYPAGWSAQSAAEVVHFFDAQGDLVGTVRTGGDTELWSTGLQPFDEALAEHSEVIETMEADAGVQTEYTQNMSVLGTVMIDDAPSTVLVLVILHEGRAAAISGRLTAETERDTIEEMMKSFRFLVEGAS